MNSQALRAASWTMPAILLAASVGVSGQQAAPTRPYDPANLARERVSAPDLADTLPIDHGALALQQLLRKLRTRESLMLIVAHPDDEDGGLLTYLSRGQGARVAMLTLNRGEGGQNLMSADFYDALGLIRTQELLAADRYMGVDQFFGTEVDFGFSKTKEETFAKWTHERVLYDAVRAVRIYRPLVIASVFIGGPSDGHGHHQVAGEITQEVFNAAGDPKVFPDQIAAGLQPWQPLKVYARSPFGRIDAQGIFDSATGQYTAARFTNYVTGKVTSTPPKGNVVIPEGTPDPLLGGLSYFQFSRQGLGLQKSQIGGNVRLASPGVHDVSYHRFGSRLNQPDGDDSGLEPGLFDGIDTSLAGIATLAPDAPAPVRGFLQSIDAKVAEAQQLYDPDHLGLTAPPLHQAMVFLDQAIAGTETSTLPADQKFNLLHELRIKRVQLNDALVLAHGLTLTATLADPTPGQPFLSTQRHFAVATKLTNSGSEPVEIAGLLLQFPPDPKVPAPIFPPPQHLLVASGSSRADRITADASLPPTRPYFSRPDIEQPFYDITDPGLRNAPATPAPLTALVSLNDQGVRLEMAAIVANPVIANQGPDAATGQPLVVVPPVSISLSRHAQILPSDKNSFSVGASQIPPTANVASEDLGLPPGWKGTPTSATASVPGRTDWLIGVPTADRRPAVLHASVKLQNGMSYSEGFRPAGYPGLVSTNYFTPAVDHIVPVDVRTAPNLKIAYVQGTGDDVPAALEDLGVPVHLLTISEITSDALQQYDAVVLGVRVYEHADMAAANTALNAYAAAGGVVIAQYNTGRLPEGTGPYPLSLGDSEKVVEEDASVQLLVPDSPLLTWPNRITTADFDGWVEERGHGFMATWDSHYTPLLETHDPGQQPQRGGLLVAYTGKGAWVYVAYALYRQLSEGVPGPYRLFANLVSLGKNPDFESAPGSAK